jgi:3-hydroxyisobutyrate dehydrogenase
MKLLTADNVKLGFIGLGNMGSRIAQRLLDHGYPLVAYDRDIVKAAAVAAERGFTAKNILELVRTADVILSCLTNDEAVQSVYTGPAGVFAEARPGTVVLEMSTISPEARGNCTSSALRVASRYWMSPSRAALLPRNKAF